MAWVDVRTGKMLWTRTEQADQSASSFLPNKSGSYDVIVSSGPPYTGTGGNMYAVDGFTGQNVLWSRPFSNRSGVAVPDLNGDGQPEIIAAPCYWSDDVHMLDGATGQTIWHRSYGSFDVTAIPQVVPGAHGSDIILSAQLSSGGGIRRYEATTGNVVWDSSSNYFDNVIVGLLNRSDGGETVLSTFRHHGQAIGLDAATGRALWDNLPLAEPYASWGVGILGVPDLTGDGSEDVLALNDGAFRLYDGVTGLEQTWFTPIPADAAAASSVPEPNVVSLLGIGAVGIMGYAWRRRRTHTRVDASLQASVGTPCPR
jgi:outer membrane protein assembly factor BamB